MDFVKLEKPEFKAVNAGSTHKDFVDKHFEQKGKGGPRITSATCSGCVSRSSRKI